MASAWGWAPVLRRAALAATGAWVAAAPSAVWTEHWLRMWSVSALALVVAGVECKNTLYLLYHTFGRDLRAALMMGRLVALVKLAEMRNTSVPAMFERTVRRHPDKIMLYFQDQQWTFRQVDEYSNRVAKVFLRRGFEKGDVVGVFMENRPEFVATWLGLSKMGVLPALINHNLLQDSLVHSIKVVDCKAVVYGQELAKTLAAVLPKLRTNGHGPFPTFCSGGGGDVVGDVDHLPEGGVDLSAEVASADPGPVDGSVSKSVGFTDRLMYIYTSGTTGMPKAALIKHSRYILASGGSTIVIGVRRDDVVYSPLPLYHSVAGMISLAGVMNHGFSMVMRKKFSASAYWADCVKYNVTAGQYIGEICRYLLNTPECPEEKRHRVRLMFGNGLRPQIWRQFVQRFNIPNISEFYGSTEGNSQTINNENVEGSVGFVSLLLPSILPLGLIKINEETGDELRDENGLCIPCAPGEPGEFVGKIVRNHPARDFHGYADQAATKKKLLRDVRKHGDLFFRSGDILVMDDRGWLYFKDRTGDTFRWKGENVSTTEVEATISSAARLTDVVVYGVKVPDTEGRAGMAAIHDPLQEVNLVSLVSALQANLPRFAWPLFVRLVKRSLDMTGTFKLKKFNLQREGFDPVRGDDGDLFYFLNPSTSRYEPLSPTVFSDITAGNIRL